MVCKVIIQHNISATANDYDLFLIDPVPDK